MRKYESNIKYLLDRKRIVGPERRRFQKSSTSQSRVHKWSRTRSSMEVSVDLGLKDSGN